jgi:NAD(P)-dependent dehydrogenase (short-subunit alcohol dehydrogenase family)
VVNISSTAALYPSVGFSAYNASKAALSMLTRTLALEWARDGIRVVGVAPGKVDTAMVRPIVDYGARNGLPLNPLDRIGRPEEVAALVAYLASDRAAYITGSIVTIDGGEVLATGDHTR